MYGTFHKVSITHLGRYCNGFSYRFNRRGEQQELFMQTTKNLVRANAFPTRPSRLRQYRSLRGALAGRLYGCFRHWLRGSRFFQNAVEPVLGNNDLYFSCVDAILVWRGRKDSDLRDVREHVSPDYKSSALDHSATAPHGEFLLFLTKPFWNLEIRFSRLWRPLLHLHETEGIRGWPSKNLRAPDIRRERSA